MWSRVLQTEICWHDFYWGGPFEINSCGKQVRKHFWWEQSSVKPGVGVGWGSACPGCCGDSIHSTSLPSLGPPACLAFPRESLLLSSLLSLCVVFDSTYYVLSSCYDSIFGSAGTYSDTGKMSYFFLVFFFLCVCVFSASHSGAWHEEWAY